MNYVYNDGGRHAAGFRGTAGDCVVRSIAIALCRPYRQVYDEINVMAKADRVGGRRRRSSARDGVSKRIYGPYLKAVGWRFVATMGFGTGCRVHLRPEELPKGRIIARVSGHMVACIDGIPQDTYDPTRNGTRCVYGYWIGPEGARAADAG